MQPEDGDVPMQPTERANIARCAPDEYVRVHGLIIEEDAAALHQAASTEHHGDATGTATTDQAVQIIQVKQEGHRNVSDAPAVSVTTGAVDVPLLHHHNYE